VLEDIFDKVQERMEKNRYNPAYMKADGKHTLMELTTIMDTTYVPPPIHSRNHYQCLQLPNENYRRF
jgi:hypothetical protein